MIKSEYVRFLQTLNSENISDDVRKIANIVLENLDTLIPLTTAQGQRVKQIVKLAQSDWESTSSYIRYSLKQTLENAYPITRMKKLSVGPFRGFMKQENFDLNSQFVLIYGPNGTGKSSFCEALEYCLLGNVAEAESSRFRNQNEYFRNAHSNTFIPPTLVGLDITGNDISISANEPFFRFCFVEKNRIDAFSRIAAQLPARQSELVSALFGLDDFSNFARNFTEDMDDRYIDLNGLKGKELKRKKDELTAYQQQLEKLPEVLEKIAEDEAKLVRKYKDGYTFTKMEIELNGDDEEQGLIARLEKKLQEPMRLENGTTISELECLKHSINSDISRLNIKQDELKSNSQNVSFKQLYEAVIKVVKSSPERCPACHTPISQTSVNPFEHAIAELQNLNYLSELEDTVANLNSDINKSLKRVLAIINICRSHFPESNKLSVYEVANEKANVDWWHLLHLESNGVLAAWKYIEAQVKDLENIDKQISLDVAVRSEDISELNRLRELAREILILRTQRESIENLNNNANLIIKEFDAKNAQLISDVEKEKIQVEKNQVISTAYSSFVRKLNDYYKSLPAKLLGDLGESVVDLYNAFNRHDGRHELLADIKLPLEQNQRLEISFTNAPDDYFDALHILSEGHIRCIGLAILAAKNIKEGCPFLIFDDPVNAIDDDHRESIRLAIFDDQYFREKQIILACHGEEFFKDIQNQLPAEKARMARTISFLPKNIDNDICVDHNCTPRNYIVAARNHLDKNERRDALAKSRKALESLANSKIWGYVNRHGGGHLSLLHRTAKAPIELRNLTEQLRLKISKLPSTTPNKDIILEPLEFLLGIDGTSRGWIYPNKGTHEEANRAEFDIKTIEDIVFALEKLDRALAV